MPAATPATAAAASAVTASHSLHGPRRHPEAVAHGHGPHPPGHDQSGQQCGAAPHGLERAGQSDGGANPGQQQRQHHTGTRECSAALVHAPSRR